MSPEILQEAIKLARKLGHIFVATANGQGLPHVAAAGRMEIASGGLLAVTSWFCPETVVNLKENKYISLVIWERKTDAGFQLLGELDNIEELGILDGFAPEIETKEVLPQVQRQLLVRVNRIIEFKHGPHSDREK